jgi:hypothetical protein
MKSSTAPTAKPASLMFQNSWQDREYQTEAVDFLVRRKGGGIRASTGAGKTFISLTAVEKIGFTQLLILVPTITVLLAWEKGLSEFGYKEGVDFLVMNKFKEAERYKVYKEKKFKIVVMLYLVMTRDRNLIRECDFEPDVFICDEAHALSNRQTGTFKAFKQLALNKVCIFLSATIQQRGPQDLWTWLHMLSPKVFRSYHAFVERYCVMENDGYSTKPVGVREDNLVELRLRVAGFVFNIPKSRLKGFVPERNRQRLIVEMDKTVSKAYKQLYRERILELPGSTPLLAPNVLTKVLKLRQLLACPPILKLRSFGPIIDIVEHAKMRDPEPYCAIFTDFRMATQEWQWYLNSIGGVAHVIEGGMELGEIRETVNYFNNIGRLRNIEDTVSVEKTRTRETFPIEKPRWLLCTIGSAVSFDLNWCTEAYLCGFSWSTRQNFQAEGRLTRGEKEFVNLWYVEHKGTVESSVLDVLNTKTENSSLVVSDIQDD